VDLVNENSSTSKMQADNFYTNVEQYHVKVDKIHKLITDYFDHRKAQYSKKFMAIEIIEGRIKKITDELSNDSLEKIEFWLRYDDKSEIEDSIYSLELEDQIFFCKIFDFENENVILAGYVLNESTLVRTFISKFSEQKIQEKYEKILAIT